MLGKLQKTAVQLIYVCLLCQVYGEASPTVCIVGSGISGATTAYFTRQLDDNVSIKVFEKESNIGGRIQHFSHNNKTIEAGGSVIHCKNRYMLIIAQELGLEILRTSEDGRNLMGIFDGETFVYQSSGIKWLDTFQILWRYGYHNLSGMKHFVNDLMTNFASIYALQDAGKSFSSPKGMLKAMNLYQLTQQTLADAMSNQSIEPKLINELAAAINRVNYGQNCTLNALAGAVGLAGSGDDLRAIKNGNRQVIEKMFKKARAEILTKTSVMSIEKLDTGSYQIHTQQSTSDHICDAVVLATPLETSDIQLPKEILPRHLVNSRRYQLTHTTFVEGILQPAFFNEKQTTPDIILTTESPKNFFSSIGLASKGSSLYKIFSRQKLSTDQLEQLFRDHEILIEYPWRAYPTFTPPEKFSDFVLDKGLIYTNAIETAASAMEVVAISGRNAALLLQKHFKWKPQQCLKSYA